MMAALNSILSNNIKHLRKSRKLSQQALADALSIKRSNIAAYESKNIEPRLRLILEMARLFDINVKDFIELDLSSGVSYRSFNQPEYDHNQEQAVLEVSTDGDLEEFVEKSMKIRKVLEGFKAFYSFKKNNISTKSPDKDKLIYDIDSFIQLMEHLLLYNESVIKALKNGSITENA